MVAKRQPRRSKAPERTASRPRIEIEDCGEAGSWFVVYTAQGKPVLWTQDPDQAREKLRSLQ